MKNTRIKCLPVLIGLFFFQQSILSQVNAGETGQTTAAGKDQISSLVEVPYSTLIVYREKMTPPLAFKPVITINGIKALRLARGNFAEIHLKPGKYVVKADWGWATGVSDVDTPVDLKAGQRAFLNVHTSMWFFPTGISAVPLASNTTSSISEKVADEKLISEILMFKKNYERYPEWERNTEYSMDTAFPEMSVRGFVDYYKKGDSHDHCRVAELIMSTGIWDEDLMALLIDDTAANMKNIEYIEKSRFTLRNAAILLKAIAWTGREEYRSFISNIERKARNKKIRKYARKYLKSYYSGSYAQPPITEKLDADYLYKLAANGDLNEKTRVAKLIISYGIYGEDLLGFFENFLKSQKTRKRMDRDITKCIGYSIHALASTMRPEYVDLLRNVANYSKNRKIAGYARKDLQRYYDIKLHK